LKFQISKFLPCALIFLSVAAQASPSQEVADQVLQNLLNLDQSDCDVRIESQNLELLRIEANASNANSGESIQVYLPSYEFQSTEEGWILEREIELRTKNYHPYFPRWTYGSEIESLEYNHLKHQLIVRITPAVIAPWRSFVFSCKGRPQERWF
tara:strand:+ start:22184 stop:22645 length:462 start_codon:yes stop_codon:yes gene_type:complete